MRFQQIVYKTQVKMALDSLVIAGAFFIGYYLRKPITGRLFQTMAPIKEYLWILVVSLPIWWMSLIFSRIYVQRTDGLLSVSFRFLRAGFTVLLTLTLLFFVFNTDVNRTLVIPYVIISVLFLYGWRVVYSRVNARISKKLRILIVGEGESMSKLLVENTSQQLLGADVIGCLSVDDQLSEKLPVKVLGRPEALHSTLLSEVVDRVIFAAPLSRWESYRPLLEICETLGVNAMVLMDFYQPTVYNMDLAQQCGFPFVSLNCTPEDHPALALKGIFDRIGALVLLLLRQCYASCEKVADI